MILVSFIILSLSLIGMLFANHWYISDKDVCNAVVLFLASLILDSTLVLTRSLRDWIKAHSK